MSAEGLNNVGVKQTDDEDNQLNHLYNTDEKTVTEIALIHKRTIGSIITKLISHKHIPNRSSARGYVEYTQSDCYKEICNKKENSNKKEH